MRRWRGAAYTYQHEASGEKKRLGTRAGPTQNEHAQITVFLVPVHRLSICDQS